MVGHLPSVLKSPGGDREAAVQLHCVEAAYKLANQTPEMTPAENYVSLFLLLFCLFVNYS